jgi:hypothetical protein
MMDENDGTGDGEWGKEICVIGVGRDAIADEVGMAKEGCAGWEGGSSEITRPEAGSSKITGPEAGSGAKPGRPRDGSGGADMAERLSMTATRWDRSPTWRCRP